ncbi:MAG: CPBP family intramembrane metalloprotease [Deltaproteobacteria bacterium]|nr:CPBP family intramembrane metalloprotease [Deltaproteobacteria bacterium]MBW2445964.1 CPBP family intramembrane metalloprotease [Deltaproteobacteria bacterium]
MDSEAPPPSDPKAQGGSPPPGLGPAALEPGRLVASAVPFYGVLFGLAWLWRSAWLGEPLLYASKEAAERGVDLGPDIAVGLLAGGVVIGLSHQLTANTRSGRALAQGLAGLLGPLGLGHIAILALLSGVAEEAFFRGALQPRVGLVAASLVFGAVHYIPRPEFRLWTLFSVAAGFLLGFLFDATGNLVAPVVAHAAINGVNLTLLVRGSWSEEADPGDDDPGF